LVAPFRMEENEPEKFLLKKKKLWKKKYSLAKSPISKKASGSWDPLEHILYSDCGSDSQKGKQPEPQGNRDYGECIFPVGTPPAISGDRAKEKRKVPKIT